MSSNQYLLDVHKRETFVESFYVEHQHSSVKLLRAVREDEPVLRNFIKHSNGDLLEDLKEGLNQEMVIMATDCFEICGVVVGHVLSDSSIVQRLDNEDTRILQVDLLSVENEYRGGGIEGKLLKEFFKLAQRSGINCVLVVHSQTIGVCETLKLKFTRETVVGKSAVIINLKENEEWLKDTPRLPEAYRLPNVKRRVLGQCMAQKLGRPLEYVVAVREDEELIKDFLKNEYFRQTTILRTLQCQRSSEKELMTRFRPEVIDQGMAFLAVDEGKLCGLCINKIVKVERPDPSTELDTRIPDDLTEEIDKQTLNHVGGRAIRAVCAWFDARTAQMLPKDCKEYFVLDMLSAHPDYRGCKIGWKLWYESLKYSMEIGCRYTQTICTAIASNRLATKFGLKKMIEFPYSKFNYNGQCLFEDGIVYDGGKTVCLYIGTSEDLNC